MEILGIWNLKSQGRDILLLTARNMQLSLQIYGSHMPGRELLTFMLSGRV